MDQTDHIKNEVNSQLTKLVYRQLPIGLYAEIIVFTLTLFVFLRDVKAAIILSWYVSVIVLCAVRLAIVYYYNFSSHLATETQKWILILAIIALLGGLSWAPLGAYFIPVISSTKQTFTIFVIIGTITVGNLIYSPVKFVYPFFLLPIYLPHIIWLFFHGDEYVLLGIGGFIYMILMLVLSYYICNVIASSIDLQFKNKSLIQDLQSSNESIRKSEEIFKTTWENAPIGMTIVSLEGKWLQVNRAMCEIVGYSKSELMSMRFQEITYPEDLEIELENLKLLLKNKIKDYQMEKRYIHKNGYTTWILLAVTLVRNDEGTPLYFIAQIQDINIRKKNEKMLQELHDKTTLMLTETKQREQEMSLINRMNDLLQICLTLNEAYPRISSIAAQLFPEMSGGLAILNKDQQILEAAAEWGEKGILASSFSPTECLAIRSGNVLRVDDPHKTIICAHYTIRPVSGLVGIPLLIHGDIIGVIDFFAAVGKSISEEQIQLAIIFSNTIKTALSNIKLRELVQEQILHDTLTGLYNRRHLDETLPLHLNQSLQDNHLLSISMLDIDNFKHFNDQFGHEAGDEVLKNIGRLLVQQFHQKDMAFRYASDTFLIMLWDTNLETAIAKMQKICTAIHNMKIFYQGKKLDTVSVSIGVAIAPDHATAMETLLLAGDQALYFAKRSGRNKVVAYERNI